MATGELTEVSPKTSATKVEPEPGEGVFLNPRVENPFDYIELILRVPFHFLPTAEPGSREYMRAEYTIEILRLNDREELPVAREGAYHSYRARVKEYIHDKQAGKPQAHLDTLVRNLQKMDHPTVWAEMKRRYDRYPELKELFAEAPEALNW